MLGRQFHPGLDRMLRRPPTLPSGAASAIRPGEHMPLSDGGLHLDGGRYDADELALYGPIAKRGTQSAFDNGIVETEEEAQRFVQRHGQPTQGVLFPNYGEDTGERVAAADRHPHSVTADMTRHSREQYSDFHEKGGRALRQAITGSRMPNELIGALGGRTTLSWTPGSEGGGSYHPESGAITLHTIAKPGTDPADPGFGVSRDTTLHELGHRADWRAHRTEGSWDRTTAMGSMRNPEPRSEGVADGFADRYAATQYPNFEHHSGLQQGYGTQSRYWQTDTDRAVYSASRAHTSATGELANAETPTALLHKLMSTSPHAVRALRQNGLKQAGAEAYDAYRESRKAGKQLSMLSEVQYTNDKTGETESAGFVPHPALAGTPSYSRKNAQGEWVKPNEENIRPMRPNETRRYKPLDYDIYDIPEDHKPL